MQKTKNLKTRVRMFKNMGGNIPSGNFPGRNFPGVSFPDTVKNINMFFYNVLLYQHATFL